MTRSNVSAVFQKINRLSKNNRIIVYIFIFGITGGALLIIIRAATSTANIEAESASLSGNASIISDANASSGQAVKFNANEAFPVHPGVVYTQANIDAWSTSLPEYTRLKNSGSASLTKTPVVFGTVINTVGERDEGLKDQSGFAKVQAVLWAADGDINRKNKAIAYLQEYATVTSFEYDSGEQYRLVGGWGCTNLAQAAEIVDYQDAGFKRFLKDVCYPVLEWPQNPNWHASFADSKLAIAAYLGDSTLWADAKAYFYKRIAQSIYHSAYDAGKINPLTNSSGVVSVGNTLSHWGNNSKSAGAQVMQNGSDFVFVEPGLAVDGANAERRRDFGHVSLSNGAWMHGARTILAQGEELEQHAYDRILAGYEHGSSRVLENLTTGANPYPSVLSPPASPTSTTSDGSRFQGYYGARKLFGAATPPSVLALLTKSQVNGYPAGGANHMVAEAFADE